MKYIVLAFLLFVGCVSTEGKGYLCSIDKECVCECLDNECVCENCKCSKRKSYSVNCSGCGQEFLSVSNKNRIVCPFCPTTEDEIIPMTDDEFNKLILELERNQK